MNLKIAFKEFEEIEEYNVEVLDLLKKRLLAAAVVVLSFFVIIVLRLWTLQIIDGEEYEQRAYSNRVRVRQLSAPRGDILDRFGRNIVTNRPSFNVMLIREDSPNLGSVLKQLAPVLDMELSDLWRKIRKASNTPRHLPVLLKRDIDWRTLAYLENHNQEFSGIRTKVQPVRVYHYNDLAANLIGYLGSISKKELKYADQNRYLGGDIVGKQGIEKLRELDLRGEKGRNYSEVDAKGFEQQLLKIVEPLPGKEIRLTLDVDLQQIAESYMAARERAGAVVAIEVKTGRLLVAASAPSIHFKDFIGGISLEQWKKLLDDPRHPLLNKVIQGSYPPGSIYKMITAFAGLAMGIIDEDTAFHCPGYYSFGNRIYRCWKRSGHGRVNLLQALERSCDVYFYQIGQRIGVDKLAEYAKLFGLGKKTGVEMEHERSGLIPTKEWKKKNRQSKWQKGETLSIAIGQGFNSTTPLQLAVMTATFANNGKIYRPQIIEQITDTDGKITAKITPDLLGEIKGFEKYFTMINRGLQEAVHSKYGTARRVAIDGLRIAGKTGTAQVVKLSQFEKTKEEDIPYRFRDHAWFTCFAPADNPEIAVTVLVEHGLHGSSAAPIARAVLNQYFNATLKSTDQ